MTRTYEERCVEEKREGKKREKGKRGKREKEKKEKKEKRQFYWEGKKQKMDGEKNVYPYNQTFDTTTWRQKINIVRTSNTQEVTRKYDTSGPLATRKAYFMLDAFKRHLLDSLVPCLCTCTICMQLVVA